MVLLRCVDAREVEQMLVEVHEGSFGMHANGCHGQKNPESGVLLAHYEKRLLHPCEEVP